MKKVIAICMALMLVGVLLAGMTTAAKAAGEGDELPTVTAPPVTKALEEPIITAMPDKPLTPEDAATDTPENVGPAAETEPAGGDTPGIEPGDVGTCTAITIICFLVGMAVKESALDNKWILKIYKISATE